MKKLSLRERAINRLMKDNSINESQQKQHEIKRLEREVEGLVVAIKGYQRDAKKYGFEKDAEYKSELKKMTDRKRDLDNLIAKKQMSESSKKYYVKVYHIDGLEQPIRNQASIHGGQYLYSEMSISRQMYAIVEFSNYQDAEKFIKFMRSGKSTDGMYNDYTTSKVLDKKPI